MLALDIMIKKFIMMILSYINNMNSYIDNKTFYKTGAAILIIAVMVIIIRRMITWGIRILLGILTIVFVFFAAPRINVFIMNQLEAHGIHLIVERKISDMVEGDIEKKVKREYETRTGNEITENDTALLEALKAEAYKIDPNLNDDLNLIVNAGLPRSITNTILINVADKGTPTIVADNFPDYVAKFFVLRITMLASIFIAFTISSKLFAEEKANNFRW